MQNALHEAYHGVIEQLQQKIWRSPFQPFGVRIFVLQSSDKTWCIFNARRIVHGDL